VVHLVVRVVVVAVTSQLGNSGLKRIAFSLVAWLALIHVAQATVLPEERADVMYHEYEGGGVTVSGPSILVRKNTSANTSVFYNYYIDNISSASLDVLRGASPYVEHRTEQSGGIDFLHGKTTMGVSYTHSVENDYRSGTLNFNLSQDFFGDLSTLTLGYTVGNDTVGQHSKNAGVDIFTDKAKINRQNYRIGLSQILSKNFVMGVNWETITDDATSLPGSDVTLNNPYRLYSYCSDPPACTTRGFDQELYPSTHTSNALAINGSYYLPFRAALHGKVKFYQDSWGIKATTYQLSYTYPLADWIFEFRTRWYSQNKADFYSDLLAYQGEYTFMARDRELSTFQSTGLGVTASWDFARNGWHWIDKGSLNLSFDHMEFDYKDYRNDLVGGLPGTEPLYGYGANIYQLYVSIWY